MGLMTLAMVDELKNTINQLVMHVQALEQKIDCNNLSHWLFFLNKMGFEPLGTV